MKNVLLFAIATATLASCAPAVQRVPAYTMQQAYTATCDAALAEVVRVAPTLRPAAYVGTGGWPVFSVSTQTPNLVIVESKTTTYVTNYGVSSPLDFAVRSEWTCVQNGDKATLTASNTGQNPTATKATQEAYFKELKLPQ